MTKQSSAIEAIMARSVLTMVCAVGITLILPVNASAQCTSTPTSLPQEQGHRFISFQGATTQQNCSGRIVEVHGWIDGQTQDCLAPFDSFDSQGNCYAENASGNAVVSVGANACRTWNGRSDHKYRQSGTTTNVQLGRVTPLDGGPCPGEDPAYDCAFLGPDYYWNGSECVYTPGSPIIISLDKQNGYKLTSPDDGVLFDIDANGTLDRIAWTAEGSGVAFLAIDRNGDGQINNGSELFGNHTLPGINNGFEALRAMSMSYNGGVEKASVSEEDSLFSHLLLWTDRNHNGISEADEIQPASAVLSDVGIGYQVFKRTDQYGNQFRYRGWVHIRTENGRNQVKSAKENEERTRHTWDVFFKFQ